MREQFLLCVLLHSKPICTNVTLSFKKKKVRKPKTNSNNKPAPKTILKNPPPILLFQPEDSIFAPQGIRNQ